MVLGVSAGIAAYKAVEVCRRLVDAGVHVAPVLTERATRFVGRATFDALGSEPAQAQPVGRGLAHPPYPPRASGPTWSWWPRPPPTSWPATPAGLADDLLTATLVATAAPVVVCPAMHTEMWEHPAVQHNLDVLRARGVTVSRPRTVAWPAGTRGRVGWPTRRSSSTRCWPARWRTGDAVAAGGPTWPGFGWWSRPEAPGSPSTRCGSSPTAPRASRGTPWPPRPAGGAPRWCW